MNAVPMCIWKHLHCSKEKLMQHIFYKGLFSPELVFLGIIDFIGLILATAVTDNPDRQSIAIIKLL